MLAQRISPWIGWVLTNEPPAATLMLMKVDTLRLRIVVRPSSNSDRLAMIDRIVYVRLCENCVVAQLIGIKQRR